MRRTGIVLLLLGCVALFSASNTYAATLGVGGSIVANLEAEPVGASLIASLLSPYSGTGFSGNLLSEVYAGDTSNPYGGLTFVYTILSSGSSSAAVTALTINGYEDSLTDASYNTPGVAPTTIDRLSADTVGFRFQIPTYFPPPLDVTIGNGVITPGATSASLIVQTNMPWYTTDTAQVIDGTIAGTFALVPVPEPSTFAMAGLGMALAWFVVRRKR